MGDEAGGSQEDDVSFLRTGDIIAMSCTVTFKEGLATSNRCCLSAEGFGSRLCNLEITSDRNVPPDMSVCMFNISQALSVRALAEMLKKENDDEKDQGSTSNKTLLYGHAIQLLHCQSFMYLTSLSTCSTSDKLAFDVGLLGSNQGEACWWIVQPGSKQRSVGEKVRVGDDLILVSVATERYLHVMVQGKTATVVASFHQTMWNLNPINSGAVRARCLGYVYGSDAIRFYHGTDECLTIPENWSDHPQHNMVIYESGVATGQARSLWRIELIRNKWHGALVGWEQAFRMRHMTSGRYLGLTSENHVCLLARDKSEFEFTAWIMLKDKDTKVQALDEKEEEGMGLATLKFGETVVFMQHLNSQLWMSYETSEVIKKGMKVEEKKAIALEDGHQDDCFTYYKPLDEESKSARVIRKCSSVLNKFLKGIDSLANEGAESTSWQKVSLGDVLMLMEDLIAYFAQPAEDTGWGFEKRQIHFRALRQRQDLFQEEGVLNMVLDTIDRFSVMEAIPDFAGLIGEQHKAWDDISNYLYMLVAAMIKGNHSNCAQFASAQRLDWLFGRLSNPQSAEGILDVLYCVLTESPEALNMINDSHIRTVISLVEKVGRDPKVLDVLSSLCEGNGVAVRSSQNTICEYLLPGKDLLLQTKLIDHVDSMMPNVLIGLVEGSAWFTRWYFECEIEHMEQMTGSAPLLRVGWGNSIGYVPYPGSGDYWGSLACGDDLFSYSYDGMYMMCGHRKRLVGDRLIQKGDVIGCSLDLTVPEIRFTLNNVPVNGAFRDFNVDGLFHPCISLSAKTSCRFLLGGNHGRLRYGAPEGFSAIYEAVHGDLSITPCFSFGDVTKQVFSGPATAMIQVKPFVPEPVDIANVSLPPFATELHEKLAENMHQLWAQHKIEAGWSFGEKRTERGREHPCLTSYEYLPAAEKSYNINQAMDTLKTISALGYHLVMDKPPCRIRPLRLGQTYQQSNGYKPEPLDTRDIELDEKMTELGDVLAKNTHNLWAREKITRGWTYGISEDPVQRRSPHLVDYSEVNEMIKEANRASAYETIRTLKVYGLVLEAPAVEFNPEAVKEQTVYASEVRTYRAEKQYAVTGGKWYYECEILTDGFLKLGWMDTGAPPEMPLGADDLSYGYDGYICKKWHTGADNYGKAWKIGDVVGAFLDLNDKTISFSLNGELLLDPSGAEMAFDSVPLHDGYVPAFSLAPGQRARFNFGREVNTLKYFTTTGLQEGYEPFCVNMYRRMPMWFSKPQPWYDSSRAEDEQLEIIRMPATAANPPCLKIKHNNTSSGMSQSRMEFVKLSMPVRCNQEFVKNKDRANLHENLKRVHDEHYGIVREVRMPQIPEEFASTDKKKKRGRSKTPGKDESRATSPEPGAASDKRSAFKSKVGASVDVGGEPSAVDKLEAPGVRMSSSMMDMRSVSNERKGRMPKMLTAIGDKVRDASASRTRKKEEHGAIPEVVEPVGDGGAPPMGQDIDMGSGEKKPSPVGGRKGNKKVTVATKGSSVGKSDTPKVEDDSYEVNQMIDQMNEYYFGVRIFPSQDPSQVWVGWVAPQFHYYGSQFSLEDDVRHSKFVELDAQGKQASDSIEMRSCFMMNAQHLLDQVGDTNQSTKVSGLLIGCLIDTSTGELAFMCNGHYTGVRFKLEPEDLVYPAAVFQPTSHDVCQFELGRIKYTLPVSSMMFKSSSKSLAPVMPPRLKLHTMQPYQWSRVPNRTLRTTALKLSDTRGWSVLCDDYVRMMAMYVPEKDCCYDILEMIENQFYQDFHKQTLNLYCKLSAQGNLKVAHCLCDHVNQEQLFYVIKNHYLAGPLRQAFYQMLISVHLAPHALDRLWTNTEYIVPLVPELRAKNAFSDENEERFPQMLHETFSIRPVMRAEDVRDVNSLTLEDEIKLQPPAFNFEALRQYLMEAITDATKQAVMNCRDLIGQSTFYHFRPLLLLFDYLVVIGLMKDEDICNLLCLLDPQSFDVNFRPGTTQKGLFDCDLHEGVKRQLCQVLDRLCDVQLRHRLESLVSFSETFTSDIQTDQQKRYHEIKATDLSPAEAARKTKEFRCPPKEQMQRLLSCKKIHVVGDSSSEDPEDDECPMGDQLQVMLRDYSAIMLRKIGGSKQTELEAARSAELVPMEQDDQWVDTLASKIVTVPPPVYTKEEQVLLGGEKFRRMIINNVKRWATMNFIESPDLIRDMFQLLMRQYNGINELMACIDKTYIIHERSINDVEEFIIYLNFIRGLLHIQFERVEEDILTESLQQIMHNRLFFQHPDLLRMLSVHENVMTLMMNLLKSNKAQEGETNEDGSGEPPKGVKDITNLVVSCSKFLCYICRTSRANQKALFENLPFLIDNATMLLSRVSLRGSVPLDVGYSTFRDNNELALALREEDLEKITICLSRCGLRSNADHVSRGYPDLGWDPIEGDRYIEFLRFCVWINGENVEENANLVIRLLIRRPECLGTALGGEGKGLFEAVREGIAMSEQIDAFQKGHLPEMAGTLFRHNSYPSITAEATDYIDFGQAIIDFYSSLVDLLAKCAPDAAQIQAGKGESVRARAILRSLISLDDLEAILRLRFTLPNVTGEWNDDMYLMPPGLKPNHKRSVVLFLDRVYGIENQEMFFRLMEQSFLPDLRAATMLDRPLARDSEISQALCRYLCNNVLPLITKYAHLFADGEQSAELLDATLHTVYRMSKMTHLANNQVNAVREFLIAFTRELPPPMLIKLLKKVVIDIPVLNATSITPLILMTLHYDRCGKYYGAGNSFGVASDIEKRLSMKLFAAIFDSLGTKPYNPDIFGRALPCLTNIAAALSPDYALTGDGADDIGDANENTEEAWSPRPVDVSNVGLSPDLEELVGKFAEHFHDSWASRKVDKGWQYGERYSREELTHPRLKPFHMLKEYEQNFYRERCSECLRAVIAWGYQVQLADPDAHERASQIQPAIEEDILSYNPRPTDLANLSLEPDMIALAERIAENSHLIWARSALERLADSAGSMPLSVVPFDLLTGPERRKDRFKANEIVKFMQYQGYRMIREDQQAAAAGHGGESDARSVERRFAYHTVENFIKYLEQCSTRVHIVKGSQDVSRRNSFRLPSKDVRFFEKVVLPLMTSYFDAHRNYFLAGTTNQNAASDKEKEMATTLFCRLAHLIRLKNRGLGTNGKLTVRCLCVIIKSLDFKTLVKINSDVLRTDLLTFFNKSADDLHQAVQFFHAEGQYSAMRGANIRSWPTLEFICQMTIPILTTIFTHCAAQGFSHDLLLEDIQGACYKVLNSLYFLATIARDHKHRTSINNEIVKHLPAIGICLSSYASAFPVAFLEPQFNTNNRYSVLAKWAETGSVAVQEMMQSLATQIPTLEKMIADIEAAADKKIMYSQNSKVFDVDIPLICSYLHNWWYSGPEGPNQSEKQITEVISESVNRVFIAILKMILYTLGTDNSPWMGRLPLSASQIIQHVTTDPMATYVQPIVSQIAINSEAAWKDEDRLRTHPDEMDESTVGEFHAKLVRDVYSIFPLLIKYTDQHRAKWLKSPSIETDAVYEKVAVIFEIWYRSQHFKREELNFMQQFEETDTKDIASKQAGPKARQRKRGDRKNKHSNSTVINCFKRLLPVGLNVFGGRELDIVQQSKEKYLKDEIDDKIREFIRQMLGIPEKTDPTDVNTWQRNLYKKIGKSQMRGITEMSEEVVIDKISNMGKVLSILHSEFQKQRIRDAKDAARKERNKRLGRVDNPSSMSDILRKVVTSQRKRAVVACFRASVLHSLPRHRAINLFLPVFRQKWLEDEDPGLDMLVADICIEPEPIEGVKIEEEEEEGEKQVADEEAQAAALQKPDALAQLVDCFQRAATSEQQTAMSISEDLLYKRYADVLAQSIHVPDDTIQADDEDISAKEEANDRLVSEQQRLLKRGVAIMILQYLSASNGEANDMVQHTLELGIKILNGGNLSVQTAMLDHLKEKRDVRFFTSVSGLMNCCSVLNLDVYERQVKAEGLGMGAELAAGDHQNLNDADFTISLFRCLQLTCEGHNLDFQNYLRDQPGSTSSINVIICTVDYLLRLQESIMDFFWHYSSHDLIDDGGKENFVRAVTVCSQVFNTLTEAVQGPCKGNQHALANSRLWDAINGFFFLFAHMMEKLSKNKQVDLLRDFLTLQKDMVSLMLSLLEGNILNGSIGKQMMDALCESEQSVIMILEFFDMFLKLRQITSSPQFIEYDHGKCGMISPKDFQRAMEAQKVYKTENIIFLMACCNVNNDGNIDYMEFTERYHRPAKEIGFNLAVLMTNLKEHITNDPRLDRILVTASPMLTYFQEFLGCIEIMGSAKRVEKVYFEIQDNWIEQWGKQQIKDSKNIFLFNVMQDDGGEDGKLTAFVNFCEDIIFEMQHAASMSAEEEADPRDVNRALKAKGEYVAEEAESAGSMEQMKGSLDSVRGVMLLFSPESMKAQIAEMKDMSYAQIAIMCGQIGGKAAYSSMWFIIMMFMTIFNFFYYMMTAKDDTGGATEQPAAQALPAPQGRLARDSSQMSAADPGVSFDQQGSLEDHPVEDVMGTSTSAAGSVHASMDQGTSSTALALQTIDAAAASKPGSVQLDSASVVGSQMQATGVPASAHPASEHEELAEPEKKKKEVEEKSLLDHFLNILARNMKSIEMASLYFAFLINIILLFHRVNLIESDEDEDGGSGSGSAENDDDDEDPLEEIYITGLNIPYVGYNISGWIFGQILYWLSVGHAVCSLALLFAFYQLKVPLITFKREKEVARQLLFDGCWLTEEDEEERGIFDMFFWYLDRVVISSPAYPMKYWDKFVRKKAYKRYEDSADAASIHKLLAQDQKESNTVDIRYQFWLWVGCIISNGSFLYRVGYLTISLLGVFSSPFFYAACLVDVVLSFPMLKAILQSVTHNLSGLILTVLMILIVTYLYTVIAFNFFRKFYVVEGEEEDEEPDRKCHNMLTCFIYHFYAGLRAGGGIGDELDPPYGDPAESWRMLFDISFFFFVIVILLAIMQGLIIDAFGELRDQQEGAVDKLENNCFICDIAKEYFDKIPKGFDTHVKNEHNFANYLFFFQHLITKDETEYTGQETYIRNMYDERNFEFFPVGECFLKQYEDVLMAS